VALKTSLQEDAVVRKVNAKAPSMPATPPGEFLPDPEMMPCVTTEDHLARIQALGRKIEEHIRFMGTVATLPGTSAESRAKAVSAFHERLLILERGLAQTLEELRLG